MSAPVTGAATKPISIPSPNALSPQTVIGIRENVINAIIVTVLKNPSFERPTSNSQGDVQWMILNGDQAQYFAINKNIWNQLSQESIKASTVQGPGKVYFDFIVSQVVEYLESAQNNADDQKNIGIVKGTIQALENGTPLRDSLLIRSYSLRQASSALKAIMAAK